MLALSTQDLPEYRIGVILVGVARCIAMVMIWNQLAGGDHNYWSVTQLGFCSPLKLMRLLMCFLCSAIIVVINSVLQIVLFAPMAIFFINVISGESEFSISYGTVAIDVLIVSDYSLWAC